MKQRLWCFFGKINTKMKKFRDSTEIAYRKTRFKHCGKNLSLQSGGTFTYDKISIGDDCFINVNAVMASNDQGGDIIIGNHVAIGPGVGIFGVNHDIEKVGEWMIHSHRSTDKNVVIEDDVWIGANAVILPGVHVGRGSVIGAGSVVTKDVEPYSVNVGVPAKKIKQRFSQEQITEHENILKF